MMDVIQALLNTSDSSTPVNHAVFVMTFSTILNAKIYYRYSCFIQTLIVALYREVQWGFLNPQKLNNHVAGRQVYY